MVIYSVLPISCRPPSYFSPGDSNVPLQLADLHAFTSLRTVGIGNTCGKNPLELIISAVMIFVGYYLYNWKLSGIMQMFYLEKVASTEYMSTS